MFYVWILSYSFKSCIINKNNLGFWFNLRINPHNETNDCKNLHVQKNRKSCYHIPISTVFDILNRKGVLSHCCPEMSPTLPAERRWIRMIPWHGASQALQLSPQHHEREPSSAGISPQHTRCYKTVIAHIVVLSIWVVFSQDVSICLKSFFLMKATLAMQNIFMVTQKIAVSWWLIKMNTALESGPAGLCFSICPKECLSAGETNRPDKVSYSAVFSLKLCVVRRVCSPPSFIVSSTLRKS